jgi:hypothetical protein
LTGNELTWSSSGIIYVDGSAIPDANIFELFPYLFRAKRPKGLNGFEDFSQKIIEMGLSDLIYKRPQLYQSPNIDKKDSKDNINWWFLD